MDILTKARTLRNNSTDAESKLWRKLCNRQLNGYKFKRQAPLGNYIVDFICSSAKLVIEIDGGQHLEQQEYDTKRTIYLTSMGYQVVRFWNNEVLSDIDGVLTALTLTLSQRERELEENFS